MQVKEAVQQHSQNHLESDGSGRAEPDDSKHAKLNDLRRAEPDRWRIEMVPMEKMILG